MVVFTCNACGVSVKKNRVHKHWQTECPGCEVLSCMDCGKDFYGDEYVAHTSCVTEAEKYQGVLFKGEKGGHTKGEKKQLGWMERARQAIAVGKFSPRIAKLVTSILDYPNVPRKRKKFENFVRNSLNIQDQKTLCELWDIFDSANQPEVIEGPPCDALPTDVTYTSEAKRTPTDGLAEDAALGGPSKPEHKSRKVQDVMSDTSPKLKEKRKKSREVEESNGSRALTSEKEDGVNDVRHKDCSSSTEEIGEKKKKKKKKCKDEGRVLNKPSDGICAVLGTEKTSDDAVLPSKEDDVEDKNYKMPADEDVRKKRKKKKFEGDGRDQNKSSSGASAGSDMEKSSGDVVLPSKDDIRDRNGSTSIEEGSKKKRKKKRKSEDESGNKNRPVEEATEDIMQPSKLHKKRKEEGKARVEELILSQESPIQVSPIALAVRQISGNSTGDRKRRLRSNFMETVDSDKKRKREEAEETESNSGSTKTYLKKHKHKKKKAC